MKLITLSNLQKFLVELRAEMKRLFVEKESGKVLSDNNYTTAEKNKLAGLNNYSLPTASADTLGGVKIGNGVNISGGVISVSAPDLSPYAKTADVTKDYAKKTDLSLYAKSSDIASTYARKADTVSEATVDSKLSSYAKTSDLSAYAKKADVAKAVNYRGSVETYSKLPSGASVGDMYNVAKADKKNGIKAGDNVVYNGSDWDNLGGTVDLSDYATKEDVNQAVLGNITAASDSDVQALFS